MCGIDMVCDYKQIIIKTVMKGTWPHLMVLVVIMMLVLMTTTINEVGSRPVITVLMMFCWSLC